MNMIKVLWFRFQQCLCTFAMLIVEGSLKWDFLDISLTTFSQSVISEIKKLSGSSFDSKCLKFNVDFKKAAKNSEKVYCF